MSDDADCKHSCLHIHNGARTKAVYTGLISLDKSHAGYSSEQGRYNLFKSRVTDYENVSNALLPMLVNFVGE